MYARRLTSSPNDWFMINASLDHGKGKTLLQPNIEKEQLKDDPKSG